jgi:predicted unusual protein kinase regulating ubiquinone biosynthesis (AarF/ABC1/UbiB family)
MAISLRPKHVRRYADVVRLLWKYGRADWVTRAGLEGALADDEALVEGTLADPDELARDLESLGPTYIKLGQLLSTRADLLPLPYLEALARLQDRVEPFDYAQVEETVERELGIRISKAFSRFDPQPIASASLGQVHRAALRDGREVAVKVQRPEIRGRVLEDLDAMAELAKLLDAHTEWGDRFRSAEIVEEFRAVLLRELDYRREAANLVLIGENLAEFEHIVVPRPVEDYTTDRVLTMDFVHGRKVTDLSPLARIEIDGEALASELFEAYLKQVLVDGVFHADPHPGNVFVTDDRRIALLDLGMVSHLGPEMQEHLLRLLMAVSEGRGEAAAEIARTMGVVDAERFDEPSFRHRIVDLVARHSHATVEQIEIGQVVLQVSRAATEGGVRPPRELTMLGKALLNLDIVGRTLAPEFDPNAAVRRYASEAMAHRMRQKASPGNVLSSVLETAEFVQRLPSRVNRILDAIADNQLSVNVEAIDEQTLVDGFQKVANRIATGLILAALIVGAALLMRIDTDFRIFGYPGLAILFFLAAAAGGLSLLVSIFLHDRRPARRPGA